MRKINIGFEVEKLFNEQNRKFFDDEGFAGTFSHLLNQGIQGQHPQGVPLSVAKVLARIHTNLQEMGKTDTLLIVEEAEYDLIKKVFVTEDTKFNLGQVRLAALYSEAVETAPKENRVNLAVVDKQAEASEA